MWTFTTESDNDTKNIGAMTSVLIGNKEWNKKSDKNKLLKHCPKWKKLKKKEQYNVGRYFVVMHKIRKYVKKIMYDIDRV